MKPKQDWATRMVNEAKVFGRADHYTGEKVVRLLRRRDAKWIRTVKRLIDNAPLHSEGNSLVYRMALTDLLDTMKETR